MTAPKFTQGDWYFDKECWDEFSWGISVDSPRQHSNFATVVYAMVDDAVNGERNEELEANAHLMVASPKMYRMLEVACRELTSLIDECNMYRMRSVTCNTESPPELIDGETPYLIQKLLADARGE